VSEADTIKRWTKEAAAKLKGRTITEVRYLDEKEKKALGWYRASVVLIFDDGSAVWPSADDEGNDAGALFCTWDDLEVIPVI
jgi:hypothetical protein